MQIRSYITTFHLPLRLVLPMMESLIHTHLIFMSDVKSYRTEIYIFVLKCCVWCWQSSFVKEPMLQVICPEFDELPCIGDVPYITYYMYILILPVPIICMLKNKKFDEQRFIYIFETLQHFSIYSA